MVKLSTPVLYYIHDPMCSWCWGFRPVWQQVQAQLKDRVKIQYVLGGLAADTMSPMPGHMQKMIQDTWQTIEKEIPGTRFNYDFWSKCLPRRSTYPACRAIIAAKMQDTFASDSMLHAIQQAYYLQARNPSDNETLIQLAEEIGLNQKQFIHDLQSAECLSLFRQERELCHSLEVESFPSLVFGYNQSNTMIPIDYTNSETIISCIRQHLI